MWWGFQGAGGPVSFSSSALPWGLLILVPACLYSGALALIGPAGGVKVDRGLARTLAIPDGAEEIVFPYFLHPGQLLLFPHHLIPQLVPPVFLYP